MPLEKPIIFSAPMVRAILEGRKTQTRRVAKPQPHSTDGTPESWRTWSRYERIGKWFTIYADGDYPARFTLTSPYVLGDKLWVRETGAFECPSAPIYRADLSETDAKLWKWTPSIYMPRRASRITLEITCVRFERLREISESDAKAEGVRLDARRMDDDYRGAFHLLWDEINGERAPWHSDPWVWVIEFQRVPNAAAFAARAV